MANLYATRRIVDTALEPYWHSRKREEGGGSNKAEFCVDNSM